jgi:hypothetical protein
MKKRIFILAILLCVPLTSMAMKSMDDKALDGISGQAGVSIMVDITMNIHIDTLAWGDADGLAPGPNNPWTIQTQGGYVGLTNLTVTGLTLAPRGMSSSTSSVSLWPDTGIINVLNGVPYYQVNAGPGDQ